MNSDRLHKVHVDELTAACKRRMVEVAATYYRDPESGLADELCCGNVVYFVEGAGGGIGCFLIIDLDHHGATLDGKPYRFTYLGLGCATTHPIVPVFREVKQDFARRLEKTTTGVLHLTTRTPYAYRSILRAYGVDVFPTGADPQPAETIAIAEHVRTCLHRQAPLGAGDNNPFILRHVKKGPFNTQEVARIGQYRDESPLSRLGIRCDGWDELIVFHTFAASMGDA